MADIADKVAALLAKAEGTDNAHEAEAYMAKAEELMLKHNVEMAQVQAKRPGVRVAEEIIIEKIRVEGQFTKAMVTFSAVVAEPFSLKAYQQLVDKKPGVKEHGYAWLVGHRSDVEQAAALCRSLLTQCIAQEKHWWRTEGDALTSWQKPSQRYISRREFYFAFGSGARSRLAETRNRVVKETGGGAELVLVDRAKKVEDWVNENMGKARAAKNNMQAGSMEARVAGYAAGRDAVHSRKIQS